MVWVEVYIGSFYRPEHVTLSYSQVLDNSLSRISNRSNCHIWLEGDFNFPMADWENLVSKPGGRYRQFTLATLISAQIHGLEQVVMELTHIQRETSLTCISLITQHLWSNTRKQIGRWSKKTHVYIENPYLRRWMRLTLMSCGMNYREPYIAARRSISQKRKSTTESKVSHTWPTVSGNWGRTEIFNLPNQSIKRPICRDINSLCWNVHCRRYWGNHTVHTYKIYL